MTERTDHRPALNPPMHGTRVIDLTRQGPGPMCCQMLAELGCEIIKVERVSPTVPPRKNPWLDGTRRQIRSIRLDLKSSQGRAIFARLAATAEVVIEGFKPGVAASLGVDYESLRRMEIDPVYLSISGYGQSGPNSQLPGHDINYIAAAGMLSLSGDEIDGPHLPGVLVADFASGANMAVIAVLAGLHQRRNSGSGQWIDLSMHESVVQVMARFLVPYFEGERPTRAGNDYLTGASPWYAVYETRDEKHVAVGAVEDHFYRALCRGLGLPFLEEMQWETDEWPAMRDTMSKVFRTRDRDRWIQELGDRTCIAPVLDVTEVARDPHLHERSVITESLDGRLHMGPMLPMKGVRFDPQLEPRQPGEDTATILKELGLSSEEESSLRSVGAVA